MYIAFIASRLEAIAISLEATATSIGLDAITTI